MSTRTRAAAIAGALLIAATSISGVSASSHREAPLIAGDPGADNTDLYAFVSPDDPNSLTIIANYIPLEDPAGGPNFFPFDPAVRYEIYVDNTGDGKADVSYYFLFTTTRTVNNFAGIPTFLFNDGPVTTNSDSNLLVKQTYDVYRNGAKIAGGVPTPPPNIGPRSTEDPAALAAAAVTTLGDGTKLFAGQRDDAFFVDLGSIFDLGGLRPFNGAHVLPLATDDGHDGVSGFNTNSIVIRVPLEKLTKDHALPTDANDPDAVLGVWAAASRKQNRKIMNDGTLKATGPWKQVSRLGNPLINEVVIPTVKKDYWNSQKPDKDSQFATYYLNPELAAVADYLYSAAITDPAATSNRGDLVAILLTGLNIPDSAAVPGGLQYTRTGSKQADMLRVNTGLKPNANGACGFATLPSRLGAIDGDLCGFPNGRRLLDDVTDIEVRAIMEGYGPILNAALGVPNKSPNNALGDGVDTNDMPFLSSFPYIGTPQQGYSHSHDHLGVGGP